MTVNSSRSAVRTGGAEVETESLVAAVVEAVAAERGVDPVELEPLYEVVDPDALDALFEPTPSREVVVGSVRFRYESCVVEAFADGRVAVEADSSQS